MDWMHCNSCYAQPLDGSVTKDKFYLTSCGHLFCEKCGCFTEGTSDCCKSCRNRCSCTLLGEKSFQSNPQLLQYFQEPEESCQQLLSVLKFQKAHRIKLIAHQKTMFSKYNRAKSYIKKLEIELKNAKMAMHNTSQKSGTSVEILTPRTPIFQPNSTIFNMINSEAKSQCTQSMKKRSPDLRHRQHLLQNELSMISTESMGSENQSTQTSSSVYASPLQDLSNENYMLNIHNINLNSFGKRPFSRQNSDNNHKK